MNEDTSLVEQRGMRDARSRVEGFYFERRGRALYIAHHAPISGSPSDIGYIVCPAFGEEGECARRNLHELACALADTGTHVMIPDLMGTGNSASEMKDIRLEDWIEDVCDCARLIRERTCCTRCGLLGLRFGCFLALLSLPRLDNVKELVLWDPLLQPDRHFHTLLRGKLVREAVSSGEIGKSRKALIDEAASSNGIIDFDGYRVSLALVSELRKLSWDSLAAVACPDVRVALVSFKREAARRIIGYLQGMLAEADIEIVRVDKVPRFWRRIGTITPRQLIAVTVAWIVGNRIKGSCR